MCQADITAHAITSESRAQRREWGIYQNVIPMRRDCGKNPILSSVNLTGSHRILPSQWPTSQIAMGPQRFTCQVPFQRHERHETLPKKTSCMKFFHMHEVCFWESFVLLEGDLTCQALRSHHNLWRGSLRWENAMGSCKVNTAYNRIFTTVPSLWDYVPIIPSQRGQRHPTRWILMWSPHTEHSR